MRSQFLEVVNKDLVGVITNLSRMYSDANDAGYSELSDACEEAIDDLRDALEKVRALPIGDRSWPTH